MKRRDFLRQAAAAGAGAVATGTGLTLLDPAKIVRASRDHAGETLTVITQSGPPIASAVQASMAPFKKLTGATVKLQTAPFGELYTKTIQNFITGGSAFDVILGASSWLGDYYPYVVDLSPFIKKDHSLNWNDVIYQANGQWAGKQLAMPVDGDNQFVRWFSMLAIRECLRLVLSPEEVRTCLAKLTPEEQRLLLALEMSLFARELARAGIQQEHPEWPHEQVARELLRLAFLPAPLPVRL